MKRFLTAFKENSDGFRTKVLVVGGVVAAAVVAGVILTKIPNQPEELVLVLEKDPAIPDIPSE